MSKFHRCVKHTKALIQAFQKPPQVRCFRARPAVIESGHSVSKDPQCLLSSPRHRWTTTMSLIPRAPTQVPGLEPHYASAFSFSSAATPQVDGKDATSAPSSEPSATSTEELVEPVQPPDCAEQKGGVEQADVEQAGVEQVSAEQAGVEQAGVVQADAEQTGVDQASDDVMTKDDLVGLLGEKLALLEEKDKEVKEKNKEVKELKDRLLWSLAEMENIRGRTKRDAEATRKFAIQTFAKGLLDVADNLSRATGAVPDDVAKLNAADDPSGNIKVLQTLLQGVVMTEKQLSQVFKKHGLEKYESMGQPFDPNRHSAVFEMEDAAKPAGTVALELKAGYILNDRVIRPAEVAVVKSG